MNTNLLRLRLRQLALKLRVLLHQPDIALYDIRVLRLKRKCQRLNLVDSLHIPPVFHTRLKVFGEVNDVLNGSHKSKNIVVANAAESPPTSDMNLETGTENANGWRFIRFKAVVPWVHAAIFGSARSQVNLILAGSESHPARAQLKAPSPFAVVPLGHDKYVVTSQSPDRPRANRWAESWPVALASPFTLAGSV